MKPRILLLSGYDAASHRYWRETLVKGLPAFDWTVLSLPDRYYSWRVRGNSLSFAFQHRELLHQPYDGILATSMVDLSALRGFVPELASIPTALYFHENQFAYPGDPQDFNRVNAQLTSIYAALCADQLWFNSEYNRKTFLEGANALFHRLPDEVDKQWLAPLSKRATVLPVPIEPATQELAPTDRPLQIIWNHRWEFDKQPEVFFAALRRCRQQGLNFQLHILGQSFRQVPEAFAQGRQDFADCIQTWGHQPRQDYLSLLSQGDVVVSTALHDFQGLSMLEAIAHGCVPVAPNRVAYPEYIPSELLYSVNERDEADALAERLLKVADEIQAWRGVANINRYLAPELLPRYHSLLSELVERTQ